MSANTVLEQTLNLAPIEPEVEIVATKTKLPASVQDYEYVKENIKLLIDTGFSSLNELKTIAERSQSPRAFEVLSKFIENLVTANKELFELNMKASETKQEAPQTVTNNLFVGTTKELGELIRKLKQDK